MGGALAFKPDTHRQKESIYRFAINFFIGELIEIKRINNYTSNDM